MKVTIPKELADDICAPVYEFLSETEYRKWRDAVEDRLAKEVQAQILAIRGTMKVNN